MKVEALQMKRPCHRRKQFLFFFEKKEFQINFYFVYLVLWWNVGSKDKGKYGKFNPLWLGSYEVIGG